MVKYCRTLNFIGLELEQQVHEAGRRVYAGIKIMEFGPSLEGEKWGQ